ncbi:MAG: MFS transporter [Clostridiales bacterium]|nr:MFS transporter [Clostridiales bacterium]
MEKKINGVEPKTLWNRSFILVMIMSVFTATASQMVTPLISKYAMSLGAPLTLAAAVSSMMSIVAMFLRPVSGLCSDRYNRKKIILTANILTSLCLAGYSITSDVNSLMAIRFLHGVVFSFSGVASMAFNTSFMPRDRIGEGLGWMAMSHIISSTVGPNLGMWIVERGSYSTCFLVASALCLGSTLILLLISYDYTPSKENRRKFDINNLISLRILPYACIMGLFSCGNALTNTYLALIGDERNIANIALFFTANSVAMIAVRPFTGKLLDRRGLKIILYPSLVIAAAGMAVLGAAPSLGFIILAGLLKALGQGSGSPSIQASCIKLLGREKAGVVSSTCYIGQDLGHSIAPTLGSFVAMNFGYGAMFYVYAVILFVGGSLTYYIKSKYDKAKYGHTM